MTAIEGPSYPLEVDGKVLSVSFQFELLPIDMKYLAFLGGELTISASYFFPLQMSVRVKLTVSKERLV